MIKCDNCDDYACTTIQWSGKLEPQKANLCDFCLDNFWSKFRGAVNAGRLTWNISPIKANKSLKQQLKEKYRSGKTKVIKLKSLKKTRIYKKFR